MRAFSFLGLGLGLLLAVASSAEASNGAALATLGGKGPVSLPFKGDGLTAIRMPAGVGWAPESRLDVDLFAFFSRSTLSNNLNDFNDRGFTPAASAGLVVAIDRPDFDASYEEFKRFTGAKKWTLHIAEYAEIAGGLGGDRPRTRSTTFPEGIETSTGVTMVTTAISLAYTPSDWFSIALGGRFMVALLDIRSLSGGGDTNLNGSPTINGVPFPGNPTYAQFLEIFSSGNDSDPTTLLESQLQSFQLGAVLSIAFRPMDNLAFGFSYSPRSFERPFEGQGTIDASRTFSAALDGLPQIIQDLFIGTLPDEGQNGFISDYDIEVKGLRVPRQIRANVAYWPVEKLVLSAEVAWIEWHRAFKRTRVILTNGDNTDVNFVIGSNGVDTGLKLRWRNQFVFSMYTAYMVTDQLTVRFGVNYGKSPINPDTQGNGPSAGFIDTHINAGLGYAWDRYELNFLVEYGVRSSPSTDTEPTELTAKNSRYSSEQLFFHLGFAYRF